MQWWSVEPDGAARWRLALVRPTVLRYVAGLIVEAASVGFNHPKAIWICRCRGHLLRLSSAPPARTDYSDLFVADMRQRAVGPAHFRPDVFSAFHLPSRASNMARQSALAIFRP